MKVLIDKIVVGDGWWTSTLSIFLMALLENTPGPSLGPVQLRFRVKKPCHDLGVSQAMTVTKLWWWLVILSISWHMVRNFGDTPHGDPLTITNHY